MQHITRLCAAQFHMNLWYIYTYLFIYSYIYIYMWYIYSKYVASNEIQQWEYFLNFLPNSRHDQCGLKHSYLPTQVGRVVAILWKHRKRQDLPIELGIAAVEGYSLSYISRHQSQWTGIFCYGNLLPTKLAFLCLNGWIHQRVTCLIKIKF